jgi:hypothetical protein
MKWLWIDPGETVGWQTGLVLGTEEPRLQLLDHGNTASQPFLLTLLTAAVKYDLIGYESYQIRQDKAQAHVGSHVPTLQVIGGIRLCAWEARRKRLDGFPRLVDRLPREKKTGLLAMPNYLTEEEQRAIRGALTGDHEDGHWADASLHAVAWHHHNLTHDLVR